MRQQLALLYAIATMLPPIVTAGCDGGVPATGSRAVQPPDYSEREKANTEGFKKMMKEQAAAKHKKVR